jgi:hypothetical protein
MHKVREELEYLYRQVGVVKIYVAAVEALRKLLKKRKKERKKERQGETKKTINSLFLTW